ncbi:uncharacterized protein METZ01_LOCUS434649, partial [marine metagenome]
MALKAGSVFEDLPTYGVQRYGAFKFPACRRAVELLVVSILAFGGRLVGKIGRFFCILGLVFVGGCASGLQVP